MTMPAMPQLTLVDHTSHRRICGWCRHDLGELWPGSQENSYAICDDCKARFFGWLYERAAEPAPDAPLREHAAMLE